MLAHKNISILIGWRVCNPFWLADEFAIFCVTHFVKVKNNKTLSNDYLLANLPYWTKHCVICICLILIFTWHKQGCYSNHIFETPSDMLKNAYFPTSQQLTLSNGSLIKSCYQSYHLIKSSISIIFLISPNKHYFGILDKIRP